MSFQTSLYGSFTNIDDLTLTISKATDGYIKNKNNNKKINNINKKNSISNCNNYLSIFNSDRKSDTFSNFQNTY